ARAVSSRRVGWTNDTSSAARAEGEPRTHGSERPCRAGGARAQARARHEGDRRRRGDCGAMKNPAAPPLIELSRVTKVYGEGDGQGCGQCPDRRGLVPAFGASDFVAVMGRSGPGKATCMIILGCLDAPPRGTYRFLGAHVGATSADQRALIRRNYPGFILQGFS